MKLPLYYAYVYTHLPVVSVNYARQNITSSSSKSATTSVASAAIAQAQWSMVSAVGIQVHIENTLRTLKNAIWLVIFMGAKNFCETGTNPGFWNFHISIFAVRESEMHTVASCMAKAEQMSTERDGNLGSLFPYGEEKICWHSIKYFCTQAIHRGDCFHSRPCTAVRFVRLCLCSTSISQLAWAIAFKGTLAGQAFIGVRTAR